MSSKTNKLTRVSGKITETKNPKIKLPAVKNVPKKPERKPDIIYLDNNSHTIICPKAEEALIKWSKYYNPSGDNKFSKESRDMIDRAVKFMHEQCGTSSDTHKIIFTSGASESNSTILRSVAYAVKKLPSKLLKPYIVASAVEHHNVIQCLEDLKSEGVCEISYIKPNIYGCINPSDVEAEILRIKETGGIVALLTIMFANNETGAINNIPKIGEIADKHEIPLHTDAVQVFGKFRINMPNNHIAAMSASFHKLYGPGGIGLLVIEQSLIDGYELGAIISGTQQGGLRGGTENVPAIAAAMEATKWTFMNRATKNDKLLAMKTRIVERLGKHYPFGNIIDYVLGNVDSDNADDSGQTVEVKNLELEEIKPRGDKIGGVTPANDERKAIEFVIVGPPIEKKNSCLPNTLLLSVAKNKGEPFCNVIFKHNLAKANVIASIASACLTSSPKSSHVLTAMDLPSTIKRGVIRISLGDYNTTEECDRFVNIFLETLDGMLKNMDKGFKGPVLGL
jgi:cysteine sulfinate desulfinase/cysteine desulfurase-like protein